MGTNPVPEVGSSQNRGAHRPKKSSCRGCHTEWGAHSILLLRGKLRVALFKIFSLFRGIFLSSRESVWRAGETIHLKVLCVNLYPKCVATPIVSSVHKTILHVCFGDQPVLNRCQTTGTGCVVTDGREQAKPSLPSGHGPSSQRWTVAVPSHGNLDAGSHRAGPLGSWPEGGQERNPAPFSDSHLPVSGVTRCSSILCPLTPGGRAAQPEVSGQMCGAQAEGALSPGPCLWPATSHGPFCPRHKACWGVVMKLEGPSLWKHAAPGYAPRACSAPASDSALVTGEGWGTHHVLRAVHPELNVLPRVPSCSFSRVSSLAMTSSRVKFDLFIEMSVVFCLLC